MKSLTPTIVKSLVFIVVTVLATVALGATIRSSSGGGTSYTALFTDATSLNKGDDVRMAGVRVGQVDDISVSDHRVAKVRFEVDPDVPLMRGTVAALRFRNLVGQRYIALNQGDSSVSMPAGAVFDTDHTQPALNLTMLFNGFQPLFRLLDPDDVNKLSYQIVQVFQGEGSTVESLLSSTARLTKTIAAKDRVIGQLIDNLNSVLAVVNGRADELSTTIVTLQRLVSGLAEDRKTIGSTLDGLGDLTVSVSGLLEEGRAPLKRSIVSLGALSKNLSDNEPVIDDFLAKLPIKLDALGRTASYGSWLNGYVCSIQTQPGTTFPQPEGYRGDYGAKPVAERCNG
ncbi:ABC transporter substrate-binding protein [Marmoricola endophyticus]|uniref:ABC transporter substrate-binding protein n=1 Tax=Marmoricola endophyticus TaxID=2040280 RepID=A0A917BCK4_9ACTN|nr:MlaD family protein [Marmoricola endophyticus]GGF37499.1 ABC transporter substrate-binding protein [Marmoricola endophyticus]